MRILFLADSIHPGVSGVGDYTLELAAQLRRMSVDAYVEPIGIPGTPLRASLCERVNQFQADWVSVQFVPYAYAHRGLVSRWNLPWRHLRGRRGTHIMFHEIWIGAHRYASWRERVVGLLQRRGIQSMINELNPSVVHCSNSLYSKMLINANISNSILPLFGNIPVQPVGVDPYAELITTLATGGERSEWVVSALFGTIHQSSKLVPAVQWLNSLAQSQGKQLLVVSLGNCSSAISSFDMLAAHFPPHGHPTFFAKGPLPADELSQWLRTADCALSTTPLNIIGKSGSVAAFLDHGVPVIVLDKGGEIRGFDNSPVDLSPGIWLFDDLRVDFGNSLPKYRIPDPSLPRVAVQFLNDLAR
jgi:hypothetical protein